MNHALILISVGLALSLASCDRQEPPQLGSTNGPAVAPPSGEIYWERTHGFTITFPSGWTVKRSSVRDTLIKAVFRDTQNRLAYITIAAYELTDITPAELKVLKDELTADNMWQVLKEDLPDFSMKRNSFGETKIRSRRAVWNTVEIEAPPQAVMFGKHFHFVKGRYMYRVSAVTDHDRPFFNSVLPTMENSIATLAFGE